MLYCVVCLFVFLFGGSAYHPHPGTPQDPLQPDLFFFLSLALFSGMMTKAEHSVHNEWFEWITRRQQPHLDLISKPSFAKH